MNDLVKKLQAAASDEEREWLVMKFSLEALDPSVRRAVYAAAIPMWFDRPFLAALLEKEVNHEFEQVFQRLLTCSFVEVFQSRGYNIHERSRNVLLNRLFNHDRDLYFEFNKKAAEHCSKQGEDASWRMAYIYHGLLSRRRTAVGEFINQGFSWSNRADVGNLERLVRPVLLESKANRVSQRVTAWAYHFQAKFDLASERFESAKSNFSAAKRIYSKDRRLFAHSLLGLGQSEMHFKRLLEAEKKIRRAQAIFQENGDGLNNANCVFTLGEIFWHTHREKEAQQKFEEAAELYKNANDNWGQALCKGMLGQVFLRSAEYKKAKSVLTEALGLFRGKEDGLVNAANCLEILGDIALQSEDYDEAQRQFEQSRILANQAGSKIAEANAIASIGELLARKGDFPKAQTQIEEALKLYEQTGSKIAIEYCLQLLASIRQK